MDPGRFDEVALPALLRAARAAYGGAVHEDLDAAGFDDVPRNGSYVLGALAGTRAPLGQIISGLGVSKQAAGQLVDTLVMRGYVDRRVDPDDRRRLTVALTERGRAAADVVRGAVAAIDDAVRAQVGPEHVTHTRTTLVAMIQANRPAENRAAENCAAENCAAENRAAENRSSVNRAAENRAAENRA